MSKRYPDLIRITPVCEEVGYLVGCLHDAEEEPCCELLRLVVIGLEAQSYTVKVLSNPTILGGLMAGQHLTLALTVPLYRTHNPS